MTEQYLIPKIKTYLLLCILHSFFPTYTWVGQQFSRTVSIFISCILPYHLTFFHLFPTILLQPLSSTAYYFHLKCDISFTQSPSSFFSIWPSPLNLPMATCISSVPNFSPSFPLINTSAHTPCTILIYICTILASTFQI